MLACCLKSIALDEAAGVRTKQDPLLVQSIERRLPVNESWNKDVRSPPASFFSSVLCRMRRRRGGSSSLR